MTEELAAINAKLDILLNKIELQENQLQGLQEMGDNLRPMQVLTGGIQQQRDMMCEASDVSMAFLARRIYEKSNMLVRSLDRLESVMDLVDEAEFLGKQVFTQVVDSIDEIEKAGYFALAEEGGKLLTQTLTEIHPEDIRALGTTISPMIKAAREVPEEKDTTLFALIKALFDPKVRKGLVRMLNLLKVLGQ